MGCDSSLRQIVISVAAGGCLSMLLFFWLPYIKLRSPGLAVANSVLNFLKKGILVPLDQAGMAQRLPAGESLLSRRSHSPYRTASHHGLGPER